MTDGTTAIAAAPKKTGNRKPNEVPHGCSKKTSTPLPDPKADRMRELLSEGYGKENKGENPHVPVQVASNKNHDSIKTSMNGGLVVVPGRGLTRNEICDTVGSRDLPSVDALPEHTGPLVSKSQLGRDLSSAKPEVVRSGLKIDPNEPMRQSNVFKARPPSTPGVMDPNDKAHRPIFKQVPGHIQNNIGVGKEPPLESYPRLVKEVPDKMKGTLKCGPEEPSPNVSPPKKNTGPMMSSLGTDGGGLVPVRGHVIKHATAEDGAGELPPETTDFVYKQKNHLFNRPLAPFAQGSQIGGGVRHRAIKKCEKRGIGVPPMAVGAPPSLNYTAEEKLQKVRKEPFGTGIVPPGCDMEDSMEAAQGKQRIQKAKKPRNPCPFAVEGAENKQSPNLDDLAKKGRITKAKREVRPAPFAVEASTDASDAVYNAKATGRPKKPWHEKKPAPFATGSYMDGTYTHMPTSARPAQTGIGALFLSDPLPSPKTVVDSPAPAKLVVDAPAPAPPAPPAPAPTDAQAVGA